MNVPRAVETVFKVHYGLEYLKLINRQPRIVLMPDMVKDQRRRKVVGAGERVAVPERTYMVGGHAAIAAHALSMLRERHEGLFGIDLIVKTGSANLNFLQGKLQDKMAGCQPVDLSYVIARDKDGRENQNRETDLVEGSDGELQRNVDPIKADLDMRFSDFEENPTNLMGVLENCTILGLLSPKSAIFQELLEKIRERHVAVKGSIFVDTSTHDKSMDDRNKQIVEWLEEYSDMIGMLSMSEKESPTLARHLKGCSHTVNGKEAARQINQKTKIPILFHTADGVTLYRRDGDAFTIPSFNLPRVSKVDPTLLNGAGDVLNAGYMLACAVRETLIQAEQSDIEVPNELMLGEEDCVLYGIALICGRLDSMSHLESGRHLNKEELVDFTLTRRLKGGGPIPRYTQAKGDVNKFFDLAVNEGKSLLPRLFGAHQLRNVPADQQCYAAEKLFKLLQADKVIVRLAALNSLRRIPAEKVVKARPREREDRLVVFVDLDGTLLDSKAIREELMWKAMHELRLEYKGRPIRRPEAVRLYNTIYDQVVTYHEAGYPSFRQVWNSPEIFRVFIALLEKMELSLETYSEEFEKEGFFERLGRVVHEIEADVENSRRVQMAHLYFDQLTISPHSDARDFLQSLSHVVGAELYVVTEGDDKTQWWKIQRSGLDDIFPVERVISTLYVANPRGWTQRLEQTLNRIKSEIEEDATEIANLTNVIDRLESILGRSRVDGSGEKTFQELQKEFKELCEQKKRTEDKKAKRAEELQLGQKIKEMFQKVAHKTSSQFYSRTIHAVFMDPQNPRKFIDQLRIGFPLLWEGRRPMKLAMVGDRYDNDILPLIRLDPRNIITALVTLGPYGQQYQTIKSKIKERPKHVASSLTDVALRLANPEMWEKYGSLVAPRGEPFALEDVDLLFRGLQSEREVFYGAAIAMVKELNEHPDVTQVQRAVQEILPRLRDTGEPTSFRIAACEALGEIGDHDDVRDQVNAALRECLASDIPELCLVAIEALSMTGTTEDISRLLHMADQAEYVEEARTATYEIGRRETIRHEQRERKRVLEEELAAWLKVMEICRGSQDQRLLKLASGRVDKIASLLKRELSKDEEALIKLAHERVNKNTGT